jgi:hypothetical protein
LLRIDLAKVTYVSLSAMGAILMARAAVARPHTDVDIASAPRTLWDLVGSFDRARASSEPAAEAA